MASQGAGRTGRVTRAERPFASARGAAEELVEERDGEGDLAPARGVAEAEADQGIALGAHAIRFRAHRRGDVAHPVRTPSEARHGQEVAAARGGGAVEPHPEETLVK